MKFYSTQNKVTEAPLHQVVFRSLAPDGGLYLPNTIPALGSGFFAKLESMPLPELATEVLWPYLSDDLSRTEVEDICAEAFNFDVPLIEVDKNKFVLELFLGPSGAFKDFGARFMARLMAAVKKDDNPVDILVATSGDTGGAVAMGFFNTPGIRVTILYPKGKVSKLQEQQLTTNGANIRALEVDGTFDDCQTLVKQAFADLELNQKLYLSSANSINLARLLPQSLYYYHAAAYLGVGNAATFVVPSGNFGNLCAGLIAQQSGLQVKGFVAANNANNVVHRYLQTQRYEPLPTKETVSNAMDVGKPSNWERITKLFNYDYATIAQHIQGYTATDTDTLQTIEQVNQKYDYVMCPHTAVGWLAAEALHPQANHPVVVLGTAHPAKFLPVLPPNAAKAVVLPSSFKMLEGKEKHATPMSTIYGDFKNWLLNR